MWERGSMCPTTLAWRTPDSPNKPAHDSVLAADSMLQYDHSHYLLPYFVDAASLFDKHVDKLAPTCKVQCKLCGGIRNARCCWLLPIQKHCHFTLKTLPFYLEYTAILPRIHCQTNLSIYVLVSLRALCMHPHSCCQSMCVITWLKAYAESSGAQVHVRPGWHTSKSPLWRSRDAPIWNTTTCMSIHWGHSAYHICRYQWATMRAQEQSVCNAS